ncbi:hypothetical protein [Streptomyces caeruleatus]|uniref:Uncharacterized protein n=1 Tax=Streptomyces caeruleatus TaxID=661399 RepID=A0A117RRF4_9ACTN|nr:hypothetical protein [Streptomyces caeruleatus]KUO05179.1 hypothetical protein AQJ67_07270 [Streptomyces caeruleatus]
MDSEAIVRELLVEGLDDWVPVDRLVGLAREESERSGTDFRSLAVRLLGDLVKDGLMDVGELGDTGFEPWTGDTDTVLARIVAALDQVDWRPAGGVCWLANTPEGDRTATR